MEFVAGEAITKFTSRENLPTAAKPIHRITDFHLPCMPDFSWEKGNMPVPDANLREAAIIFRKFLSPNALWLGDNLRNQASALYGREKYAKAIEKAEEALKIYAESFGTHHANYPTVLIVKGLSLTKIGQPVAGGKILREALPIRRETLPPEHFWTALAKGALGENLII